MCVVGDFDQIMHPHAHLIQRILYIRRKVWLNQVLVLCEELHKQVLHHMRRSVCCCRAPGSLARLLLTQLQH